MDAANAWRKCAEEFGEEVGEEWGGGWRERAFDGGGIKWRGFHAHPVELRISGRIGAEVCPCREERKARSKSKFSGEVAAGGAEVAGGGECIGALFSCMSSKRWRVAIIMHAREQRAVAPVKVGDRKQRRHQGIVPWCLRGVWWGLTP